MEEENKIVGRSWQRKGRKAAERIISRYKVLRAEAWILLLDCLVLVDAGAYVSWFRGVDDIDVGDGDGGYVSGCSDEQ